MEHDFNLEDISTIIESINYSKDRIRNSPDTPYEIRQQNLQRLDSVSVKLRQLRDKLKRQ